MTLTIADTDAAVRVVDITNEADELEGHALIVDGKLHPEVFGTRGSAHHARVTLQRERGDDPDNEVPAPAPAFGWSVGAEPGDTAVRVNVPAQEMSPADAMSLALSLIRKAQEAGVRFC